MGRVYNALVRADRWEDRQRVIGSPASAERAVDETPSFDFEDTIALTEEPAPLPRRPTIAGSALHAAASAPLPRRAASSSPRPVFESLATSQPPTPAFE